jgi:aquaporin Z
LGSSGENPARSIGPALFAGGTALSQLWVFVVGPVVGGLIAAGAYRAFRGARTAPAPSEEAGRLAGTSPA